MMMLLSPSSSLRQTPDAFRAPETAPLFQSGKTSKTDCIVGRGAARRPAPS